MFELLFLFVFVGVLFFTGVTVMTVSLAIGVSFLLMFVMGMLGFVLKLLPWLIVIGISVWIYKNYVTSER